MAQKQYHKANYYDDLVDNRIIKPSDVTHEYKKFVVILVIVAITLIACLLAGFQYIKNERTMENQIHTSVIGQTIQPCKLVITITGDVEPVDATLYTPDGKDININHTDKYVINNNSIIITTITKEIGDWTLDYNNKQNKHININFDPQTVDQLLLSDINYVLQPGHLSLSFTGLFGDSDATNTYTYRISLTSRNAKKSITLKQETTPVNTQVALDFDLPAERFTSAIDWVLQVTTYDEKDVKDEKFIDNWTVAPINYKAPE